MKGRIGVESEGKDKGSTFWFTIPYKPEIATQQNKRHEAVNPTATVPQQKPVILIAEDNENNYLLFDSILNKEYNLIHAWNGEEAIELYRKFQPHVIIMDINMPKMDGYEAAREIRKFSKRYPSSQLRHIPSLLTKKRFWRTDSTAMYLNRSTCTS